MNLHGFVSWLLFPPNSSHGGKGEMNLHGFISLLLFPPTSSQGGEGEMNSGAHPHLLGGMHHG